MLRGALLALLLVAAPAAAQELRGITLNAQLPADYPAPQGTETQGPFSFSGWTLAHGNGLSATTSSATGEVLYVETWWGGSDQARDTGISGLVFGETTLAEIRARFGSNGFFFGQRGGAARFGDTAAFFTSYEIEGGSAVLSLVTILPAGVAEAEGPDGALLDSVIIGHGPFLDTLWGPNRGLTEGYARIADPT